MYNYKDFIIESQFKKWESLNENKESLMDSISKFLDKEYTIDTSRFEIIVGNLFKRFKNRGFILTTIATIVLASYLSPSRVKTILSNNGFNEEQTEKIISSTSKNTIKKGKNEIKKFLNALAKSESSMNPNNINDLGYIGKYQFGEMALKDLGLDSVINTEKFRENPKIFPEREQDRAMVKLLKLNKGYLGDYIEKYNNKIIGGVRITKSGLLAGSHLVGASYVKKFLDSNGRYIPKDGNDVPVTVYIKKFGGYDVRF